MSLHYRDDHAHRVGRVPDRATATLNPPGTRLFGIGGLMVVVGAVAFVGHVVVRSVLTVGVDPAVSGRGDFWVPINALGALAAALVLMGLPAVYVRLAGQGGVRGLVGFALIEVAVMNGSSTAL